MSLYIGINYHPHDWPEERWKTDVELMKQAGFNMVRLGHLCWDSYEPEEGRYTFEWFDKVMDLFADAGIKVFLDISLRPAPVWVHQLCPGCNIYTEGNVYQPSLRRYMEDVQDPAYQYYAFRFAKKLVNRYREHPALFAFGLCNEIGDGYRSRSGLTEKRFINWLKHRYGTVEALNNSWATRRWSRRVNSFEEVFLPENDLVKGAPEAWLDMRRFFSDGNGEFVSRLAEIVEDCAPGIPHFSNHYAEKDCMGFDYLRIYERFVDYPGIGFYPGYDTGESYQFLSGIYRQRLAETGKPMWCLEFQTGSKGLAHGPYGALYMQAMLCLLNSAEMILGWTWRSMTGGEEQYLYGLLGHDGIPGVNYKEYQRIAVTVKKLEKYGFPYLPEPDIAVAFSCENDWVIQYSPAQFQMPYRINRAEINRIFFQLNRDYRVVAPEYMKGQYKLLILPEYVVMSQREAEAVRKYVKEGGCVIMTGYSATVNENGQVFDSPRPGYLSDVFGIRISGFERVEGEQKIKADEMLSFPMNYYEILERNTAETYAEFVRDGACAVSVNQYGKGKAFYVAGETSARLLKWLIECLTEELGLTRGMDVPDGIQARRIAENQYFYVNTTDRKMCLRLPENGYYATLCTGYGVLSEKAYEGELELGPYEAELILTMKSKQPANEII